MYKVLTVTVTYGTRYRSAGHGSKTELDILEIWEAAQLGIVSGTKCT